MGHGEVGPEEPGRLERLPDFFRGAAGHDRGEGPHRDVAGRPNRRSRTSTPRWSPSAPRAASASPNFPAGGAAGTPAPTRRSGTGSSECPFKMQGVAWSAVTASRVVAQSAPGDERTEERPVEGLDDVALRPGVPVVPGLVRAFQVDVDERGLLERREGHPGPLGERGVPVPSHRTHEPVPELEAAGDAPFDGHLGHGDPLDRIPLAERGGGRAGNSPGVPDEEAVRHLLPGDCPAGVDRVGGEDRRRAGEEPLDGGRGPFGPAGSSLERPDRQRAGVGHPPGLAHPPDLLVERVGVRHRGRERPPVGGMEPQDPAVAHRRPHLGPDPLVGEEVGAAQGVGERAGLLGGQRAADAGVDDRLPFRPRWRN